MKKFFVFIFAVLLTVAGLNRQVIAKEFTKLPAFNWVLVTSGVTEDGTIKAYLDTKNLKTVDNKYKIYWEKFEQGAKGKMIGKYAIDCGRNIRTLMGGIQYNVNDYVLLNVEEYTENNFKTAADWEYVSSQDLIAKKVCSCK